MRRWWLCMGGPGVVRTMSMAMEGAKSLGLGSNGGGSSTPSVSGAAISSCHVINTPHLDMTWPAGEGGSKGEGVCSGLQGLGRSKTAQRSAPAFWQTRGTGAGAQ